MRKFILLVLIATGVTACGDSVSEVSSVNSQVGESQNVAYDPSACKTNAEGMVYFALGREVFRRPYEEEMTILSLPDEEKATLPQWPDPNEPEGCPDNPIRGRNFSISYQFQPTNPEAYPPGTQFRAREISFIAISEKYKNATGEYETLKWGLQPSLELNFERVKAEYTSCEVLMNGLNACRVPEPGRDVLSWTTKFQADPEVYSTPFNRLFTVSCLAWPVVDQQDCTVSYNYTDDTRIHYEFELHELPPLEIIEFDKGLRSKIESMRVFEYRWAGQ